VTAIDYVFKIVLLGEGSVGKTCLVYRYIENRFSHDFRATLGVNLLKKEVHIGDDSVSASIWDLGGQDSYRSLRKLYLEGSQAALVIFDVTNRASFLKLTDWIQSFIDLRGTEMPMMLIGNKIDLIAQRAVTQEEIDALAAKYKLDVVLTSALSGEAVEDAFNRLIEKTIKVAKARRAAQA
jgi:small GTP-binding protein